MLTALRRTVFALIFFCFSCTAAAWGQIPSVSDVTSTPVPNAGHDYIHAPVETVNPANGSLSIRIPVSLPPSRGFTVPFSFAYDSNGAYYLATPCSATESCGGYKWVTTMSRLSQGGWSYTVPMLSVQSISATIPTVGPTDKPGTFTCQGRNNFVLQDMQGNRRNLGLTYFNTNNICQDIDNGNYTNASGAPAFNDTDLTAHEGSLYSQTTGNWPSYEVTNSPGLVNPVTVTDGDGTSYYFAEYAAPPTGCCNTTSGTIPASRNLLKKVPPGDGAGGTFV